jgi:3-methyladenine DNA glycosylase Tag
VAVPPPPFAPILAAAGARHGPEGVAARLSVPRTEAELRALPDHRYLSQMSLRVFRAGLKHELVDRKWPAFEEVWHGFDPARCAGTYDEDIEAMLGDRRLVRHLGKLRAVRANAVAILEVARERGDSFGAWVAGWPGSEIVGLWDTLAKRFILAHRSSDLSR